MFFEVYSNALYEFLFDALAQAGAKHVYSTEASEKSEQAKPIADNPGLSSAITVGSVYICC